jgi:hypothetical protein
MVMLEKHILKYLLPNLFYLYIFYPILRRGVKMVRSTVFYKKNPVIKNYTLQA